MSDLIFSMGEKALEECHYIYVHILPMFPVRFGECIGVFVVLVVSVTVAMAVAVIMVVVTMVMIRALRHRGDLHSTEY